MSLSSKRHRTPSQSSSSTSTSTPESNHPSKASRTTPVRESAPGVAAHPLLCTLPPTCNHRPTPITNTRDLENHYATYHAHVCEESRCGSVFPDARLLELVSRSLTLLHVEGFLWVSLSTGTASNRVPRSDSCSSERQRGENCS
jgi:hypothetical protein